MSAVKQFRFARDEEERLTTRKKEKLSLSDIGAEDFSYRNAPAPENVDDLLTRLDTQGSSSSKQPATLPRITSAREVETQEVDAADDLGVEPILGTPEETTDPVRIYLREMRRVPLLNREEEVKIAKRLERGQWRVLRVLSRSPFVIRKILTMASDLENGVRSINEIVAFDEEEITDKVLCARLGETVRRIDEINKHYKRANHLARCISTIHKNKKLLASDRRRTKLDREIVRMSLIFRKLSLTSGERKRLVDCVKRTAEAILRSTVK